MKKDDTIASIIMDIKAELKEEKGIELSEQEIFEIVNSQFIGGAFAVLKGLSFIFKAFGNFVFKNKDHYIRSVREVQKLKDKVSEEEYKEIIKQKRIANVDTMKISKIPIIRELSELPDNIEEVTTIKEYENLYQEVINNE